MNKAEILNEGACERPDFSSWSPGAWCPREIDKVDRWMSRVPHPIIRFTEIESHLSYEREHFDRGSHLLDTGNHGETLHCHPQQPAPTW